MAWLGADCQVSEEWEVKQERGSSASPGPVLSGGRQTADWDLSRLPAQIWLAYSRLSSQTALTTTVMGPVTSFHLTAAICKDGLRGSSQCFLYIMLMTVIRVWGWLGWLSDWLSTLWMSTNNNKRNRLFNGISGLRSWSECCWPELFCLLSDWSFVYKPASPAISRGVI